MRVFMRVFMRNRGERFLCAVVRCAQLYAKLTQINTSFCQATQYKISKKSIDDRCRSGANVMQPRITRIMLPHLPPLTGAAHNFSWLAHNSDRGCFYAIFLLRHKKIYPASRDIFYIFV